MTHISDSYNRAENTTRQFWTMPVVPGPSLADNLDLVCTRRRHIARTKCVRVCSGRASSFANNSRTSWRNTTSDQQDLERMVQAERLLDRALAHYSREPIAGFERRMVNRLQLEAGASATLWRRKRVAQAAALVTLFAITAAASLFIGLYLGQRQANVV